MKKLIELDENLLTKLKVISAFEDLSVKALIEKAVEVFVNNKEKEQFEKLTQEQKEDIGLLLLINQVDITDTVSEEDFLNALK